MAPLGTSWLSFLFRINWRRNTLLWIWMPPFHRQRSWTLSLMKDWFIRLQINERRELELRMLLRDFSVGSISNNTIVITIMKHCLVVRSMGSSEWMHVTDRSRTSLPRIQNGKAFSASGTRKWQKSHEDADSMCGICQLHPLSPCCSKPETSSLQRLHDKIS